MKVIQSILIFTAITAFQSLQATLVPNGDFAAPAPADWFFSLPDSENLVSQYVLTGGVSNDPYVQFQMFNEQSNFKFWQSASFLVEENQEYDVSFFYQTNAATTSARINWYDSNEAYLSTTFFQDTTQFGWPSLNTTTDWTQFQQLVIAPVGAAVANFTFGSAAQWGAAALDEVVVTAVPEPSACALFGLALIFVLRSARRTQRGCK